jgi:hypothetical protein
MPEPLTSIDPEALVAAVDEAVEDVEQEWRAQRLTDLLEDDEIYNERDRRERFRSLIAAPTDPWTKPVKPAAPAVAPGAAAPGAAPAPGAEMPSPHETEIITMNADAQYTVSRDPAEAADADGVEKGDAELEQPEQQVPVQPPAAVPVQPPVQ